MVGNVAQRFLRIWGYLYLRRIALLCNGIKERLMGSTGILCTVSNETVLAISKETQQYEATDSLRRPYYKLASLFIAIIAVFIAVLFLPTKAFGLDLAKGLVYDHAYGVANNQVSLMWNGASNEANSLSIVNHKGEVLQEENDFSTAEGGSYYYLFNVSNIFNNSQCKVFPFPKVIDGKVKYAIFNKYGIQETDYKYDMIDSGFARGSYSGFVCTSATDKIVDIYNETGSIESSLSFPVNIGVDNYYYVDFILDDDVSENQNYVLKFQCNKTYGWRPGLSSFVEFSSEDDLSTRVIHLDDGLGDITISKTAMQNVLKCVTSQATFDIDCSDLDMAINLLKNIDIKGNLIAVSAHSSYSGYNLRYWNLDGERMSGLDGKDIEAEVGTGNYLYIDRVQQGEYYQFFETPKIVNQRGDEIKTLQSSVNSGYLYVYESRYFDGYVVGNYPIDSNGFSYGAYLIKPDLSVSSLSKEEADRYIYSAEIGNLPDGRKLYTGGGTLAFYTSDLKDLKIGAYALKGNLIFGYASVASRTLSNGQFLFYTENDQGKYGAIDQNGNVLIDFQYNAIVDQGDPASTLILLKKDGAWEFFDLRTLTGEVPPSSNPIPVESVTLDKTSLVLTEHFKPGSLKATVLPANADDAKNITWQTSNPAVATVEGGVVMPVGAGSATITASCGGKSATCTVTVEAIDASVQTPDDSEIKGEVFIKGDIGISDEILNKLHLAINKLIGRDKNSIEAQLVDLLKGGKSLVCAYDIHFENADGDEHEFANSPSPVAVHIALEDEAKALLSTMNLSIYHVPETGSPEKMESWHPSDGYIAFETNHFSNFVIVAEPKPQAENPGDTPNSGDSNGNTTTYPPYQNGTKVSGDPKSLPQTSDDRNVALIPLAVSALLAVVAASCFVAYGRKRTTR